VTAQAHALIGTALLAVSLIASVMAIIERRGNTKPSGVLRAAVLLTVALLVVQVLVGLDLWSRGARPIGTALDFVHIGGPIVALLGAVYHVFVSARNPLRNYAVASIMTFALALISYFIGEMGGRVP
jgi:heme A synthase